MLKVGLTGGLASGKSFVGQTLRGLGCHLIRADELGHRALDKDGAAYKDVVAEFGREILNPDGTIDRKKLGRIVFSGAEQLERLNQLVHPHVFRMQDAKIAEIAAVDPCAIVVVEAAIMIETGSQERYQKLILVVCTEEQQMERALARDGLSREEVAMRLGRQLPLAEKIRYADYVIDNSGSREATIAQTEEVYRQLKSLQGEVKT
jgi:dephospho-CoA kinase